MKLRPKIDKVEVKAFTQCDLQLNPGDTLTIQCDNDMGGKTDLLKTNITKKVHVKEAFAATCTVDGKNALIGGFSE